MEELIINNSYLQLHPLWNMSHSTLTNIAKRDYPNKNYFISLNIDALDIDAYEKKTHKGLPGNLACTGDAVVGIAKEKNGNVLMHPAVMIVELRMGYKRGDKISLTELRCKVAHTKELLSTDLQLHPIYYFIFTDREEPQARYILYREAQEIGRMQNYKTISVSDFTNNMKSPSQKRDHYKYSETEIMRSLSRCYIAHTLDLDNFCKQFYYWLGVIEQMKINNNQPEIIHINKCLNNVLMQLNQRTLTDDETIFVEILKEELENKSII